MLCAAMLWPIAAFAQRSNPCDPRYHFITSNCTTIGEQVGKNFGEMRESIAEENARIAAGRKQFWETLTCSNDGAPISTRSLA